MSGNTVRICAINGLAGFHPGDVPEGLEFVLGEGPAMFKVAGLYQAACEIVASAEFAVTQVIEHPLIAVSSGREVESLTFAIQIDFELLTIVANRNRRFSSAWFS